MAATTNPTYRAFEDQMVLALALLLGVTAQHRAEMLDLMCRTAPALSAADDTRLRDLTRQYQPTVTRDDVARARVLFVRHRMAAIEAAMRQVMTPEDRVSWDQGSRQALRHYETRTPPSSVLCHLCKLVADEQPARVLH